MKGSSNAVNSSAINIMYTFCATLSNQFRSIFELLQDFKIKDVDLKASAAFSFGSKNRPDAIETTPAPTAYNAGEGKESLKHKSPAFSMGARQDPLQADSTPAPNTYDTRSKTFSDKPGVSIK